ncbi:MAG: phenylalanine--tRNA ligase subunit beta [Clostridia bacterium]|nr:phenylalanine--tRNA ligase subunit beta [Clostridia bacterium]
MLAPYSWLKEYVDIDVSPAELEKKLFDAGFEVEELIEVGADISGVVVGKVLSLEPIPDTHLHVCQVDCGDKGVHQICCGADNVQAGGVYPVALPDATVYATARDHVTVEGVMTIKKGKLRGYESHGMLCSGVEIGLNEDLYPGAGYCGLLVLPEDAPLGEDVKPIVGLDDYIFDIGITANRPDCQSIIGIAREVAAALGKPFKMPALNYNESGKTIDFSVTVEAPDLCPRYIGHYVSNITVAPSPAWMRRRLALVGIHGISNIVDITNYVLKEFGQPMHAFDLRQLEDKKIVVRRANAGEKIVTLDEKEFTLNPEHLVICDGKKPVALAGIMGGLNSEITEDTTEVLFEAAKFARDNVRRTARALGQSSDSSARFEKGVDAYTTGLGMDRALHLIEELGCGTVSATRDEASVQSDYAPTPLTLRLDKIQEILGITIPEDKILYHLSALDFAPATRGNKLTVMVPPYREDIDGHEQDIAEELIRSYGYEHINATFLPSAQVTTGGRTAEQKRELALKLALCDQGYYESIFYSFFSPADLDLLKLEEGAPERDAIRIMNPISEDLSLMRTTLVPSMIRCAVRNLRRGNMNGRFFEIANIFEADSQPLTEYPNEHKMLSLMAFGDGEDFFTFKAATEAVAEELGLSFEYRASTRTYLHPGICAEIFCQGKCVGVMGAVSHEIREEQAFDRALFVAELDYEMLCALPHTGLVYRPLSKFTSEKRDLALVMDEAVTCGEVQSAILSGCKFLSDVTLFDVFRSDKIGQGKKSMAFTLTFAPTDHAFTGEELDGYVNKILRKLEHTMGITLR